MPSARRLLLPALIAACSVTLLAKLTLLTVAFTRYETEALPSIDALLRGNYDTFLTLLPAYGGSIVMRSPFALGAHWLGGGDLAVYRAMAAPCLLAVAVFATVLWAQLVPRGRAAGAAAWIALAVVAANPVILPALDTGHPEELLGAVLCAGAVIAALRGHALGAGVLLGLAGANKAWALFAVIPVLMALPAHRIRALLAAGLTCGVVIAPILLHSGQLAQAGGGASPVGDIFQPWQAWWFFGSHGAPVYGAFGIKPGFRTGPGWVGQIAHQLVVIVPLVLAVAVWIRGRRQDALLLLASCLLLRCVLDPWDNAYYHLPFLMALAAHEVVVRRRAPVAAAGASVFVYGVIIMGAERISPDAQAVLYLAGSTLALAAMTLALLAPARLARITAPLMRAAQSGLPALARLTAPAA